MSILTDKKTGRLFIQFDFEGRTYKKRLPENILRKDAEKLETKFKNQLFFEANGIEQRKKITFELFLADYYLPYAKANFVQGSYETAKKLCQEALKLFKGRYISQIKAADIEKFKAIRAKKPTINKTVRKPATVVREMGVISKIFTLAVINDFIDYNPCSRVTRPIVNNIQDDVLTIETIELFLDSFKSCYRRDYLKKYWARDVSVLILNTGLRQNDALGLTKFDVDWNKMVIKTVQGKTKRAVEIPINEVTQAILKRRQHNGSELYFPSPRTGKKGTSIKKALQGACERAKIGKLGTRVLRRTFGTLLDEMNFSAQIVAKLLGHSDMRSVHRYQRGKTNLREAVEALNSVNPKITQPRVLGLKKIGGQG